MPFRHGKNTKVLSAEYDISSYLNESSTSESVETGETTTYNTTGGPANLFETDTHRHRSTDKG